MTRTDPNARRERSNGDWKAWLGGMAIRAVMSPLMRTCRPRVATGAGHLERILEEGRPVVFACWHDRLFYLTHFLHRRVVRRGHPITALISRSRDGDFGETLGRSMGARVVRGSSSRGGPAALRALVKEVRGGQSALMVVDGPKGPRHRPKPGAVNLARLGGAPLVPLTWTASHSWHLGTWDAMEIPKPGARVLLHVGEPITVARHSHAEALAAATARLVRGLHLREDLPRDEAAADD